MKLLSPIGRLGSWLLRVPLPIPVPPPVPADLPIDEDDELPSLSPTEEATRWQRKTAERIRPGPRPRPWTPADEEQVLARLAAETDRCGSPLAAAQKLFGGRR